jgi:hypothetical protein
MKKYYFCVRDNSHVEPANCTLSAPQKAKQVHPSGRFYQRLEIISAAKWGEPVLFYSIALLVLILNHSLFGQNEKPFNPVKGGNSKYLLHTPLTAKKSRSELGFNGRPVPKGSSQVSNIDQVQAGRINKKWSGELLVQMVGECKDVLKSQVGANQYTGVIALLSLTNEKREENNSYESPFQKGRAVGIGAKCKRH